MTRAENLATKWANADRLMEGATIYLPEGEAVVIGQAAPEAEPENIYGRNAGRYWWAWSVTEQAYVLIKDNDKRGNGGWYEYRRGDGAMLQAERIAG